MSFERSKHKKGGTRNILESVHPPYASMHWFPRKQYSTSSTLQPTSPPMCVESVLKRSWRVSTSRMRPSVHTTRHLHSFPRLDSPVLTILWFLFRISTCFLSKSSCLLLSRSSPFSGLSNLNYRMEIRLDSSPVIKLIAFIITRGKR